MVFKVLTRLLAAIATFGALALLAPSVSQAGVCPQIGFASDCNQTFTIGPGGVVVTTFGPETNYDGVEDALIGIVNNSGVSINTIFVTGVGIFGFDGDGAASPACNQSGGAAPFPCFPTIPGNDPGGYGGLVNNDITRLTTFTIVDVNSGFVHFGGGLASGETAWFSLEEQASARTIVRIPEPGTLALLGLAATAFGFSRRRRT